MSQQVAANDLKVLYIEDEPFVLKHGLRIIRERFDNACGVRSLEEVQEMVDDGYSPDLVILDCTPLRFAEDEDDDVEAGDALNEIFFRMNTPVVILTGLAREKVLQRTTYKLHPPVEILQKPVIDDTPDKICLVLAEKLPEQFSLLADSMGGGETPKKPK